MSEEKREKRTIRLHVYDTELPIRIFADEEEIYRRAARMATDTINAYTAQSNGQKSHLEVLYMSLVDIALKFEFERKRNDIEPYTDILQKITSEIEETLRQEKH